MLSSKTLATVMIYMAVCGVVVSGFTLWTETTPVPAPAVELATATPTKTSPETHRVVDATEDIEESPVTPNEEEATPPASPSPPQETTLNVVTVPAVNFEAPTAETAIRNGVVEPDDFTHIFRVTGLTAEVWVTHSCRYDDCPGDAFMNITTGEVLVQPGQELFVEGKPYVITEARTVSKDNLPYDKVWSHQGVAVITCFQNSDYTPSTKNLVIVAQPADIS